MHMVQASHQSVSEHERTGTSAETLGVLSTSGEGLSSAPKKSRLTGDEIRDAHPPTKGDSMMSPDDNLKVYSPDS